MKTVVGVFLPDGDSHFTQHLEEGPRFNGRGTYQQHKIERALAVTRGRRLAVDIGAHVGLWSMVFAAHFERVVAFEPVPQHVECFRKNLVDRANVDLHQTALGEADGSARIALAAGNSGNAHVRGDGGIIVDVSTLDGAALSGVDLVKIDVEGFEDFVIRGGENTIRREKPVLVVEQKPGHAERYGLTQTAAVERLRSWGAEVAWVAGGDYCMVWR